MKSKSPSLTNKLYPAYRVIWRGWICLIIALALQLTSVLTHHGGQGSIIYLIVLLLYVPFDIAAEYRKPKPTELGFSDPSAATFSFSLFAVMLASWWLYLYWGQLAAGVAVLVVSLAATLLAYLVRPRAIS